MLKKTSIIILIFLFKNITSYAKTIQEITKKNLETQALEVAPPPQKKKIPQHSMGIGLSHIFLYGDFNNPGKDHLGFDLTYNYLASHSFDFNATVHYSKRLIELLGFAMGIKGKLYQFDGFNPYFLAGFGLYRPQNEKIEAKFVFGNHLALGVDLLLNKKFIISFLTQYHNPFDISNDEKEFKGSFLKIMMLYSYIF